MNILDENVPESERQSLMDKRIPIRQIGYDMGHKGLQDQEIIPFLHRLRRPTFFTRDSDFYTPKLRHAYYCLVYLRLHAHEGIDIAWRNR